MLEVCRPRVLLTRRLSVPPQFSNMEAKCYRVSLEARVGESADRQIKGWRDGRRPTGVLSETHEGSDWVRLLLLSDWLTVISWPSSCSHSFSGGKVIIMFPAVLCIHNFYDCIKYIFCFFQMFISLFIRNKHKCIRCCFESPSILNSDWSVLMTQLT